MRRSRGWNPQRPPRAATLSAALLLAASLGLAACRDEAPPASTPEKGTGSSPARTNLVLVTLDTVRADALGAYGQRRPTTPRIDALAREGVLFEQVATSNPETLPAHATILTGRWPLTHGVRANAGYVLPDGSLTLAEVLRSHGYRTGVEVAARVLRRETGIAQGFDQYRGPESPGVQLKEVHFSEGAQRSLTKQTRVGADISARGIDFLRENRGRPFFLWLHYFDAHDPYVPPPHFAQKIPDSAYHAAVASADFQVGLVIDEIERLGLRDRTLVAVTADHGEGLGEHGEPSHSYFVYDTTMHVPLVLWGPREIPRGRRVPSLVRTADLAPTLLELMQLPGALGEVEGVSLAALVSGTAAEISLPAYGEATRFSAVFGLPVLRSLREGSWKYVHKVSPELYDVAADPGEATNLASRRPEVSARLREQLSALMEASRPPVEDATRDVDAATAAELEALGYVARSPGAKDRDALRSLELWGEDPRQRIGDSERLSIAAGLIDRREFAQALELLTPVRKRGPESAYVLRLFASALLGLGRSAEATPALARVLEIDPCDERSGDELAHLFRERREYRSLSRLLAAGVEKCEPSFARLNNHAWALATLPEARLRDGARAVGTAQAALAKAGPEERAAGLDTLAAALAEAGRFEEAQREAERALQELRASRAPAQVVAEVEAHAERYRRGIALRDPEEAPLP